MVFRSCSPRLRILHSTPFLHSYNSQDNCYSLITDKYCDLVEGKHRSDRRPAVAEAEVIGEAKSDELKGSGTESVGFLTRHTWGYFFLCAFIESYLPVRSSIHPSTRLLYH